MAVRRPLLFCGQAADRAQRGAERGADDDQRHQHFEQREAAHAAANEHGLMAASFDREMADAVGADGDAAGRRWPGQHEGLVDRLAAEGDAQLALTGAGCGRIEQQGAPGLLEVARSRSRSSCTICSQRLSLRTRKR
jgi:hypothetical protein